MSSCLSRKNASDHWAFMGVTTICKVIPSKRAEKQLSESYQRKLKCYECWDIEKEKVAQSKLRIERTMSNKSLQI